MGPDTTEEAAVIVQVPSRGRWRLGQGGGCQGGEWTGYESILKGEPAGLAGGLNANS